MFMFEPSSMVLNPPSMSNLNSLKAKSKSINPIHIFYFIEFEPFEYTKNFHKNFTKKPIDIFECMNIIRV